MALSGWSASNLLRLAAAPISAAPLTMAMWGFTSVAATQTMAWLCNSGATGNRQAFQLLVSSGGSVGAQVSDASTAVTTLTPGTISASTWFHACGVWPSNSEQSSFINGVKANALTGITPTGLNRTSIGVRDNGAGPSQAFGSGGTGLLAEFGLWSAALTDDEVAALAKGVPPPLVRPQSLAIYLPIVREVADYRGGNAFGVVGSLAVADHCRIMGLAG